MNRPCRDLEPLANGGNAFAQLYLGVMYNNGEGVPQNFGAAGYIKWWRMSAEQGGTIAQYNLGGMYEHGRGVQRDYVEAVKWYRMAADCGLANVGMQARKHVSYKRSLYAEHQGGEILHYSKAAEQDEVRAQQTLGIMYDNGQGVEQTTQWRQAGTARRRNRVTGLRNITTSGDCTPTARVLQKS